MSVLEKNLAAMEGWTKGSAGRVCAAGVVEGFELVEGTDGVRTYRRVVIGEGGKKLEWLGGTSMPAGSAGAIVGGLSAGTGNGLGLSIGTGYEWKAFAGKLSGGQALFVWEPEAGAARMALTICDLSEELGSGKIVLVVGDAAGNAGEELSGFLRERLGFESPTVLHPLGSVMGERRNGLIAAGEGMVRRVMGERAVVVGELMKEVGSWKLEVGRNGVVAMTAGERYRGERPLHGELATMGVVEEVRVDHFASASLAWRLKVLAERRVGRVVSDYFRGQLVGVPEWVGVETWVPPVVGAGFWQRERFAGMLGGDRVVVQAGVHREMLELMGVKKEAIEVRSQKPEAGRETTPPEGGTPNRVAVIGEVGEMEMEGLGIVLPTHQAVYAAAREMVEAEYLSVHFGMAGDILRRSLSRAGVDVAGGGDEGLKEPMLRMIRDVLIPAAPLVMLAKKLKEEGMEVELVGEWPGKGANWEVNWGEVGVLVHLSPWGVVSPLVLEAAQSGVAVVSLVHASDKREGALPELAKLTGLNLTHMEPRQMMQTIKSLLRKCGA